MKGIPREVIDLITDHTDSFTVFRWVIKRTGLLEDHQG